MHSYIFSLAYQEMCHPHSLSLLDRGRVNTLMKKCDNLFLRTKGLCQLIRQSQFAQNQIPVVSKQAQATPNKYKGCLVTRVRPF